MPARRIRWAVALFTLAFAIGAATFGVAGTPSSGGAAGLALASLGLELFLGLMAIAGALLSSEPLGQRLALQPSRLPWQSLGLLVLGTLGLSQGLDGVLEVTGLREQSSLAEFDARLAGARGPALALTLLGIGIAPGIAEELLCRGLIQKGLERSLGTGAALVVAAIAFGALHLDPIHGAFATVLGLYLGLVMVLAGSLRAAILCHAVNNLLAVTATAFAPGFRVGGAIPALLGFAVAGACLGAVLRHRPASPSAGSSPPGPPAAEAPGDPPAPAEGLQPRAGSDEPEG
jgi:membrane protease YdiL (CAAX protease family)